VFADAVYHSRRLNARLKELTAYTPVTGTIVCFDLAPEAAELAPAVLSVVRWPFPEPAPEPAPDTDTKVFSVDGMTNERIPERTPRRAEPYRTIAWRGPRSGDQPAFGPTDESIVLDPKYFSYGIQHIEGRVHIVRCRTELLVRDPVAFSVLAAALARAVFAATPQPDHDIVLFARDEGSLLAVLPRLALALTNSQEAASVGWRGRMFEVPLVTTRRGSMQFIKSGVGSRLEKANPLPVRSSRAQLGFEFEDVQLRDGYTAVFLDNASVTGRASRDFAVAMAERERLIPSAIVVFSIVNKLSASEERFHHQVQTLAADAEPNRTIALRCAALVQLRVRSWRRLDSLPQIQRLKELFARTARTWSPELAAWANEMRTAHVELAGGRDRVSQFPLVPLAAARPVSLEILRLRHLLALHQQGVPVADDVARAFHQLASERNFDILTVFALEPELVDERPIDAFMKDLTGLALEALEGTDRPMRTNALLVLFYRPRGLDEHACRIARAVLNDPAELMLPWLALTCALDHPERDAFIEKSASQAKLTSAEQPANETLSRAARVLRAEQRVARLPAVPDDNAAKKRLWDLLRAARSGHHFGWWEIHSFVQGLAVTSAPATKLPATAWDRAQNFLESVLIPAVWSVERLAGSLRPYGIADGATAARLATAAFDRARAAHDLVGTDRFQRDELDRAWADVSRLTLGRTIDFIYAHETTCVLGENIDGHPILHRALPDLVQDPLGLLLHSLSARLSDTCRVSVEFVRDGTREYASSTLRDHRETHLERWRSARAHRLPVIWYCSAALRETMNLVALNIRQHADLTQPVSVTADLEGDTLTFAIKNQRRSTGTPGSGMGLREIGECLRKIEGAKLIPSDAAPNSGTFCVSFSISVKHLMLPPPDPTGGEV